MPECSQWKASQMRQRSNCDDNNKAKHVCSTQYVPGTLLSTSQNLLSIACLQLDCEQRWGPLFCLLIYPDALNSAWWIIQFSSVAQSCLILCNPTNHSTPGLPVHHQLLEFTQTHVHWVGDAIQPPHPLSTPSSSHLQSFPTSGSFHMSHFFTSGGQNIGVSASTSVFAMNT